MATKKKIIAFVMEGDEAIPLEVGAKFCAINGRLSYDEEVSRMAEIVKRDISMINEILPPSAKFVNCDCENYRSSNFYLKSASGEDFMMTVPEKISDEMSQMLFLDNLHTWFSPESRKMLDDDKKKLREHLDKIGAKIVDGETLLMESGIKYEIPGETIYGSLSKDGLLGGI